MLFTGRVPFQSDVRIATEADAKYVLSLHRANAEALGWFPAAAFADRLGKRLILIARDNGEPCGYLMTTGLCTYAKITHACIQYDARGRLHGFALVHRYVRELLDFKAQAVSLRCRDGLPSNLFWEDAGFSLPQAISGTNKSGLVLHNWWMSLVEIPATSPYLVPGPADASGTLANGSSQSRDTLIFPTKPQVTLPPAVLTGRAALQAAYGGSTQIVAPAAAHQAPAALSAREALQAAHAARHAPGRHAAPVAERLATPAERTALLAAVRTAAAKLRPGKQL